VKQLSAPNVHNVLIIFPHPDDETFACGGVISHWAKNGTQIDCCVFTKGECGVEGAIFTPSLKEIRTKEMQQSAKALGISTVWQYDFGDGHISEHQPEITTIITELLQRHYDIVITYDQSGLYGHPDHMVVSKLVTEVIKTKFPRTTLWYTTKSVKQLQTMKLPTHMATDPAWLSNRTTPDFVIIPTWADILAKMKSLYAHKSQHFAFIKNKPSWVPLWVIPCMQANEYFSIGHQGEKL
jgi:LmbE family N-acetylglucosaminyl deacetylase